MPGPSVAGWPRGRPSFMVPGVSWGVVSITAGEWSSGECRAMPLTLGVLWLSDAPHPGDPVLSVEIPWLAKLLSGHLPGLLNNIWKSVSGAQVLRAQVLTLWATWISLFPRSACPEQHHHLCRSEGSNSHVWM